MYTVSEASALVRQYSEVQNRTIALDVSCLSGEYLRQPIYADRDYPPFDRVAMDGIAIQSDAWHGGQRIFKVVGCQKAGEPQQSITHPQTCLEVMTGAPLPLGADCVVPYEEIELNAAVATIGELFQAEVDKNVHKQASDVKKGQLLLSEQSYLRSPDWAVLASVGCAHPKVSARPRVAMITTGDEIVAVDQVPKDYQIRGSNSYAVLASLRSSGYDDVTLLHLRDEKDLIYESLRQALQEYDVIILSGGVSMGKFDFIPSCLADLQVKKIIHKIRQKPGKPFWFGVSESGQRVFGLPGNPVSALVCCHRYVLPSLNHSLGGAFESPLVGKLSREMEVRSDRTYFSPVKLSVSPSAEIMATPVETNGSGDFLSLAGSHGFMEFAEGHQTFKKGDCHPVYLWQGGLW